MWHDRGMRASLAGTLLVLALAVAGCGGSSPSPQQILGNAVKAADSASSLHITGDVPSNGQRIGIDLWVAKDKGATGSLTLGGQKVQLIIVGKDGYMNGPAAFWTKFSGSYGALIARALAGKWLKFPVGTPQFQPIVAFASPKALFDRLQSGADSCLRNDGKQTYQGQTVIALNDGAKNGTLYVAATGTQYPVAVVKGGSGGGAINFGGWNQPVTPTAPTNVVTFSQLLNPKGP